MEVESEVESSPDTHQFSKKEYKRKSDGFPLPQINAHVKAFVQQTTQEVEQLSLLGHVNNNLPL